MNFLGYYRKLTASCQQRLKEKKNRGMTGITSTIGFKKRRLRAIWRRKDYSDKGQN